MRSALLSSVVCVLGPLLLAAACTQATDPSENDDEGGAGGSGAGTGTGGAGGSTSGQGGSTSGAGGTGGQGGGSSGAAGTNATGGNATGGNATGGNATGGNATGGVSGAAGGGASGASGTGAVAGSGATAGAAGSGGTAGGTGSGALGDGMMTGMGRSMAQYHTAEVGRNGQPYILITNGWGPGFDSHTVSWNGTSFIVEAMEGSRGSSGQPASYPTVFCGRYSVMQVPNCGLPRPISEITTLRTGWRWAANGNAGAYNAAYDIWLGTETGFGMYLMVWLRDPPGEQPAGSRNTTHTGVTVANVPGVWDIWNGTVNNRPIINWVRQEGMDSTEIEFDVMDFVRDAQMRGLTITGTQVNAVAVGFEIWQGPVTNLASVDFYVNVN